MNPDQLNDKITAELEQAASRLTVADAVGLALRDHRRRLGLSQRAYAAMRHLGASTVARLETMAGVFRLDTVVGALDGTGYSLAVVRLGEGESGELAAVVQPTDWSTTELLARVRGDSRRFPAHHETMPVTFPPRWWWHREFFTNAGPEPRWYAPRPPRTSLPTAQPDEDEASPAA
ncbi:hypothetical protein BCF74_11537 [Knoellia remsis]|uniref:Helix-turn-helix protein n=1 Tax=Knoellia remsis TaxID=407159 RepID=A0A2T0UHW8_9MICO|nr:helix-turn-helix domain-containing protein [Knoellia remsis]PRY57525.1 hypothetical protein BCF74_11537 [Knoellia remsis]